MRIWSEYEQLYYYVEHSIVEDVNIPIKTRIELLTELAKYYPDNPSEIAIERIASIANVPLYDADGESLWSLHQE